MVNHRLLCWAVIAAVQAAAVTAWAQQAGSIQGVVYDRDFDTVVPEARVTIANTGRQITADQDGRYFFDQVESDTYTLVFSKDGFTREVVRNVVVAPGQVTDVDAYLTGDFTEMQPFVAQDLQIEAGTEASVLEVRFDSRAMVDGVSADFLSKAGAGDAAAGLRLVAGATTTSGSFAAVRGLPPRFVSTQLNGVVLPSADPDTRAVQLDLFPSEIIESIQVSKTFTPDQQGTASGGAVNIITKSVPESTFLNFSSKVEWSSKRADRGEFLIDRRGEVPYWASDEGRNLLSSLTGLDGVSAGQSPDLPVLQFGAPGPAYGDSPIQYEWGGTGGFRHEFNTGVAVGGVGTFFWDQSVSHEADIVDEERVLSTQLPFFGLAPDVSSANALGFFQTVPDDPDPAYSSLFSTAESTQEITVGGMATVGLEAENHSIDITFMQTHVTTSTNSIAEDKKGKQLKFPGHDPTQRVTPGGENDGGDDVRNFLPFRRLETQEYVERQVQTFQVAGNHTLDFIELGEIDGVIEMLPPVIDWTASNSFSKREEPGTIFFDSAFLSPDQFAPDGFQEPLQFIGAGGALGAYNVIFRDIQEDSKQYRINLELPFRQWTGDEGAIKFGFFEDRTRRRYSQDTFTNPANTQTPNGLGLLGTFEDARLSDVYRLGIGAFAGQFYDTQPRRPGRRTRDDLGVLQATPVDFRYVGDQTLDAWYWMLDVPVNSWLRFIGGVRYENTRLQTDVEADAAVTEVFLDGPELLKIPGAVLGGSVPVSQAPPLDADLRQEDILPSLGVILTPTDDITFRASYSETIARPTFRELTPVSQSLFFGQTPFVGNPFLELSSVDNYDFRIDYVPFRGGLISASYFRKDVDNPIQVVRQAQGQTSFVIPVNFPNGQIKGWEFEVRQELGEIWSPLAGLMIGGNATLLNTEVTLRDFEADQLARAAQVTGVLAQETVDMTNAPEHLYNLFMTYELAETGTQVSIFYTVRGDTLITTPGVKNDAGGAGGTPSFYIPAVYERDHDTLNLTVSQKIAEIFSVKFSAKNLTNPKVETYYSGDYIFGGDVVKTSTRKGIELSLAAKVEIEF